MAADPETARGRLARARAWVEAHPTLATFLFLAPAMVAVLLWSFQGVALEPGQRFWIVVATIGLAAACAWIINWE